MQIKIENGTELKAIDVNYDLKRLHGDFSSVKKGWVLFCVLIKNVVCK